MRVFASVALLAAAAPLLTFAQDEFTANPNSGYFQGDIDAEYHQVKAAFSQETADNALVGHAVSFDLHAEEEEIRGRRLGTPSISAANMWADAVMPWEFGSSYGTNQTEMKIVEDALVEITTKTGITFVKRKRGDGYKRWVTFIDGAGCSSAVGDTKARSWWGGGSQQIRLKQRRPDSPGSCRYLGIVAHEVLVSV
jgi:hypothetical protein